ncbi:MAG TPA: lamin tail domain-containing protein [Polyangiaceae bacterium]
MKPVSFVLSVAGVALSALTACSDESDPPAAAPAAAVELSLAETPEDARCLRVTFDGARDVTRLLSLTPGQPASFTLDRLPVGLVNVDAQAFPLACKSVASSSVPSFALQAPETVQLRSDQTTRLSLKLVRNGRIGLEVEFEETSASGAVNLAVIGDTPYGSDQLAAFPALVNAINAAGVSSVVHVGDVKNGSTSCDTAYFQTISRHFAELASPLVYTPGDNEWTDCHRANNGAYDPLERLSVLRQIFYPEPGVTLGAAKAVLSQASVPAHSEFVENQLWIEAYVVLSTVHVVGSSNGYAPWFGNDTTGTKHDDPERRIAEVEARIGAALEWISRTFDLAERTSAPGVVVFMQADTFQGSTSGFVEIIRLIAERSRAFGKPVLLVQGDSHRYLVDAPLATGSAEYEIGAPVPNLTRLVVEGETVGEWLRLSIAPGSADVFSWERVPVGGSGDGGVPTATVVINEVSSNPNPDWVELLNVSGAAVDVGGWTFGDNDPTHVYTLPVGTTIPQGGSLVLREGPNFAFGLGSADSAILRDPAGAVVDQHSWTAHVSSQGRCPDGTGPVVAMTPSPGAVNVCP